MKLAQYLDQNRIRPSDFARTIGESASNLSDWKAGRRLPRLRTVAKIEAATAGQVTARDFVDVSIVSDAVVPGCA